MKRASSIITFACLLAVGSLQAKWSRIPIIKEKPVDIAISGPQSAASLDSSAGFGQVDAILTDDITAAATVSAGKSFVIINLGKPVLISQSSFVNDGVEGRAILSASADKNGWAVLEEKVFSAADRNVEFKFAGIQAKFVKLELALSKGGMLRAFHFYGGQTDKGYAVKQDPNGKEGKPMDLLNGLGGARIVYAAPKPANGLDTAVTYNKFAFPESDEKYRTIIYDMGQLRILNTFTSVHSPRPVRFEVFAFDNLPEKEDWRGRLAFDPNDFQNAKPVAVAEDTRGAGYLKAKPEKPVKTRYLALRWEPEFNPPDFQCSAGGEGMVQAVVTTNSVVITNADGTKSVVTVTVGDAAGAGAGSNKITPDSAAQAVAAGTAASSDTTTIVIQTFAPGVDPSTPGAQPVTTSTQSGTSTVTVAVVTSATGEKSVVTTSQSKTVDTSGNTITTAIQETKAPDGTTTTTLNQTTSDPQGQTISAVNNGSGGNNSVAGTTTVTTGTNSTSNNLSGGGGSPAPNGGGATSVSTTITPAVTSP